MIVVSDASPIISLSDAGHLHLLGDLYGKVHIPEAVFREVIGPSRRFPDGAATRGVPWIASLAIRDLALVKELDGPLDRGEAEAIALAVECGADLLLMDERRGRETAKRLGLNVTGVLGALVEAKSKGLLPAIRPVLEDLLTKAGFRLSRELYKHALRSVGETLP